jgi:hypothetical protein
MQNHSTWIRTRAIRPRVVHNDDEVHPLWESRRFHPFQEVALLWQSVNLYSVRDDSGNRGSTRYRIEASYEVIPHAARQCDPDTRVESTRSGARHKAIAKVIEGP